MLNSDAPGRLGPTLGARPRAAPGISTERTAAILAGATRLISGYIERTNSMLRVTAVIERSVKRQDSFEDPAPDTLVQLADLLSAGQSSRGDAVRSMRPGEEPSRAAPDDFEQRSGRSGIRPRVAGVGAAGNATAIRESRNYRAGRCRQKLDALTAANLEVEEASLNGDRTARLAAMERIGALSPGDTQLARSLAETELTAGHICGGGGGLEKADAISSERWRRVWNSMGYARC